MSFSFRKFDLLQLRVIAAVWVVAIGASVAAMASLADATRVQAKIAADAVQPMPTVKRSAVPLADPELDEIVRRLSVLHPGVKLEKRTGGTLRVMISDSARYGDWRATIGDLLQAGTADTVFRTVSICGAGCGSEYCSAEFSAMKVRYTLGK
jgi:hypothetical protein